MFQKIIQDDSFELLPTLRPGSFDAVITDPPYASGGLLTTQRRIAPVKKYQMTNSKKYYPNFGNDCRDQRSHLLWSVEWLRLALRVTRPGGWLCCFTDWRQLPTISDALQVAGWRWAGIVVWDKTEQSRPARAAFRNQCEYVLTATNGALEQARALDVYPAGVCRTPVVSAEKFHLTGKPVKLMEHLFSVLAPGALVLDPFAGSGTTLVAARNKNCSCLGIEQSREYAAIANKRLAIL